VLYFKGKNVLITAGPTYEKIDDVRFIGNFSTGKMGFALAEVARDLGANVSLIAGPSSLASSNQITRIDVTSAKDMHESVFQFAEAQDIIIMAAAVADYTPKEKHSGKIKKSNSSLTIELVPTKDILKELGHSKLKNQIIVGFALESTNLLEYAKSKLEQKKCNIIVANQANTPTSGFGTDLNTVTIIDDRGGSLSLPTASKKEIAESILHCIAKYAEQR
jgi:phosphopantothenoylcysteine decarboxylase/phosphopantothenate--cysteine ligase